MLGFMLLADDFDWGHMGDGGWIVMGIGMLLFWALVVVAIVWAVRELADRDRRGRGRGPSALELLERRLATGEIGVKEYEQRRRVLERDPP